LYGKVTVILGGLRTPRSALAAFKNATVTVPGEAAHPGTGIAGVSIRLALNDTVLSAASD